MYKNKKTGQVMEYVTEDEFNVVLADTETMENITIPHADFKKQWKKVKDAAPKAEAQEKTVAPTATEEEQAALVETAKGCLQDVYERVNVAYFGGRLPQALDIAIGLAPTPFKQYDYVKDANTLLFGGGYLNGTLADVALIMFHLAIHVNCALNNVVETCQNGRYHNRVFQKMAEGAGFKVEMNRSIGYGILTAPENFGEQLAFTAEEMAELFLPTPLAVVKTAKNPMARKSLPPMTLFECPNCGAKARAREDVSLVCGKCGVDFIDASLLAEPEAAEPEDAESEAAEPEE